MAEMEMRVSAEAYGRRNFVLSTERSGLLAVVVTVPVLAALEVTAGLGGWGMLCLIAAYVLGAALGVETGTRSVEGGLLAARRWLVWLLSRGDLRGRGLIAFVVIGMGAWLLVELARSVMVLSVLLEAWPRTESIADQHAQAAALARFVADIAVVGTRSEVLAAAVAGFGLLGMFWSGVLDGIWLGSTAARTGMSWRRLLLGMGGWKNWERSRGERRRAYWGADG